MFDEINNYVMIKNKNIFNKKLIKLEYIYRCQRGNHYENYERMIPNEQYCKDNRWNPDGVAFLYLGYDDKLIESEGITNIQKTCFEEIRLKKEEYATICRFRGINYKAKLMDLCIDKGDLGKEEQVLIDLHNKGSSKLLGNEKFIKKVIKPANVDKDDQLMDLIKTRLINYNDICHIERYVAALIISDIVDAIFVAIDKIDNPKVEEYAPFRVFAKYLMGKGYSGIIYKSTRMELIGEKGKNIVLFNKKDAVYCEGSMKVYYYDGDKYSYVPS